MAKVTERKFLSRVEELGITDFEVTKRTGYVDIDMWTPKGSIFSSNGAHCLVVNIDKRFDLEEKVQNAWGYAVELLKDGIEACQDADCEHCNGE